MADTPADQTTRSAAAKKGAATRKRNAAKADATAASREAAAAVDEAVAAAEQTGSSLLTRAQAVVERAVDIPVGAALVARERLGKLNLDAVRQDLHAYEARGAKARTKAQKDAEHRVSAVRKDAEGRVSGAQARVTELSNEVVERVATLV
jgi:hypothetical protein